MRKKKSVYEQYVEICTLEKGSSWRDLGDSPYLIGELKTNDFVFVDGKVHFFTKLTEDSSVIACFDFHSEQFQQVPFPPLPTDDDYKILGGIGRIGVFEGCLIINIFRNIYMSELWVMKEYDVKDSWTKAFAYSRYRFDGHAGMDGTEAMPLKDLGNGDTLVLESNFDLVIYNPVTCCTPVLSIEDLRVIAYRPSLLRLKYALMGYDALVLNAKLRWREQECEGSAGTEQLFTEEEVQTMVNTRVIDELSSVIDELSSVQTRLMQTMNEKVARHVEKTNEKMKMRLEEMEKRMKMHLEEMEKYVPKRTL